MTTSEQIGERIKRLRLAAKLSQQDLGQRLKISRVAVTKWEAGDTSNIKLTNLIGLSHLFNISIDQLVIGSADSYQIKPASPLQTAEPQTVQQFPDNNNYPKAVKQVISIMMRLDDIGKGRVLERAITIDEEQTQSRSKTARLST